MQLFYEVGHWYDLVEGKNESIFNQANFLFFSRCTI